MRSTNYSFTELNHNSLGPRCQTQQKSQTVYASLDALHHLQTDPYVVATLKPNHIYIQTMSLKL